MLCYANELVLHRLLCVPVPAEDIDANFDGGDGDGDDDNGEETA